MATTLSVPVRPSDDPSAHFPKGNVLEFSRGQTIYDFEHASRHVYLVSEGTVMVSRVINDDKEVVMDIFKPPEMFGEGSLVNGRPRCEQAIALEKTRLTSCTPAEIVDSVTRNTALGMALLRSLAQRESELTWRMKSLAFDTIHVRVARSLIRLSGRLGSARDDGFLQLPALTHKVLSQFVGSTREIVTHHMTEFRRLGYLSYSRAGIVINRDALIEWVRRNSSAV